ncbi:MAG: hypothetical protein DRN95_07990, partial [Candidatus Hydrothermarchaeota archaeon]
MKMNKKILLVFILSFLLSLTLASSKLSISQTTVVKTVKILAAQDAYIKGRSSTNYGSEKELIVGRGGGEVYRTFIYFNLSSLPHNAIIVSAKLWIQVKENDLNTDTILYVRRVEQYWSEDWITWYDRSPIDKWSNAGGDIAGTVFAQAVAKSTDPAGTYYYFDITEL